MQKDLQPLRKQLSNNLWQVIDNKPLETLKVKEYLIQLLINNDMQIKAIPYSFLCYYAERIEKEYADILDWLEDAAKDGKIAQMEKYVQDKINGQFLRTIDEFKHEYHKHL